jgi:hypothetical protein
MNGERPPLGSQKGVVCELLHVGELSGVMYILALLARGGVFLQAVQQAQLHECDASSIWDKVSRDGGFCCKLVVKCLSDYSRRDGAVSPSQSGKEDAVSAGIKKARIAATSKGKQGLENLGSAVERTL